MYRHIRRVASDSATESTRWITGESPLHGCRGTGLFWRWRLVPQEETNNRHQCQSDSRTKESKHQNKFRCLLPTSSLLKKGGTNSFQPRATLIQRLAHSLLGPCEIVTRNKKAHNRKKGTSSVRKRHKMFINCSDKKTAEANKLLPDPLSRLQLVTSISLTTSLSFIITARPR